MLQLQWTTFAAAIIAAIAIGLILGRLFASKEGKNKSSLRKQLDELKKQHQLYQINVTEHFSRTTDLIAELNTNYSRIQEHLHQGAEEFLKPEYQLESARTGETTLEDLAPEADPKSEPSRPLDYAPKNPNEEGTLSETFGFKKNEFTDTKEKSSS